MSKANSFYNLETIGGILLFTSAMIAIAIANSEWREEYHHFLNIPVNLSMGDFFINKPLHVWINDGLMAIYFMLVGLEIKRELKRGLLSDKTSAFVPAITALSGLVVPALIFVSINYHHPIYLKGWAIPCATDIAFTLGIMALLSKRVPLALKILITAIAIFDDIGAIAIIALFYTNKLSLYALIVALSLTCLLLILNIANVRRTSLYIFIGVIIWAFVLKSGVHATLAGIIIAMTIPDEPSNSILTQLENSLHPWVVFLILPLFSFANAGVTFIGLGQDIFTHSIVVGIGLGLFVGKQIGIFLPLWYFVKKRNYLASYHINLKQIYAMALICGVGFTMSLFIGSLAYQHHNYKLMEYVKIGVLGGSLISAIAGYIMFYHSKDVVNHVSEKSLANE